MPDDTARQTTPATKADIAELQTTLGHMMDGFDAMHKTVQQILAACTGDGSGLLVEALNQLTHEIKAARERMDAVSGRSL